MRETKQTDAPRQQKEQPKEAISLDSLSQLTGFPVEFIKKELLILDDQTFTLDQLRSRMLKYLDQTNSLMQEPVQ